MSGGWGWVKQWRAAPGVLVLAALGCAGEPEIAEQHFNVARLSQVFSGGGISHFLDAPAAHPQGLAAIADGCGGACGKISSCAGELDDAQCQSLCRARGTQEQVNCFNLEKCEKLCGACLECYAAEDGKNAKPAEVALGEICQAPCEKLAQCRVYDEKRLAIEDCQLACSTLSAPQPFAGYIESTGCTVLFGIQ